MDWRNIPAAILALSFRVERLSLYYIEHSDRRRLTAYLIKEREPSSQERGETGILFRLSGGRPQFFDPAECPGRSREAI